MQPTLMYVLTLKRKSSSCANPGAGEYFGEVRVVFDERGDAAWGRDDDMGAAREPLGLRERLEPTDGREAPDPQRRPERAELLGELRRELARGGQRERGDAVGVLPEAVQDGQRERGRLAAPGLGDAQNVLPRQRARDAPALHGRRALHAQGAARVDEPLRQAEVRKRGGRRAGRGFGVVGLACLRHDGGSRVGVGVVGLDGGGVRAAGLRLSPDLWLGLQLGFGLGPPGEEAERSCLAFDLHGVVWRSVLNQEHYRTRHQVAKKEKGRSSERLGEGERRRRREGVADGWVGLGRRRGEAGEVAEAGFGPLLVASPNRRSPVRQRLIGMGLRVVPVVVVSWKRFFFTTMSEHVFY